VKEVQGILNGFSSTSYAKIKPVFSPKEDNFEVVVDFTPAKPLKQKGGVFGCIGKAHGFYPFFIENGGLTSYLSTNGSSWDLASGVLLSSPMEAEVHYRVKCAWDGKSFAYYIWQGKWCQLCTIVSSTPIFSGNELQFGLSRSGYDPFMGSIDLTKCYISIGGKLWWEGVKGAYYRANR